MDCKDCRETLSARLDGEASAAEERAVDVHLQTCARCRRFADEAAHVTRLARTTVAAEVPDVVEVVLAAAPRVRRLRLVTALRVLLGLIGVAQLTVALGGVLAAHRGGHEYADVRLDGTSLQHFAHEIAAWNLALGVSFLWVAWRSSRTSGVVPTLVTFVVVLTALEVFDLAAARIEPQRMLTHGTVLLGLILVIVLDRRRRPVGGSAPGGASSRGRSSSSAAQVAPVIETDHDGRPGLRPSAQHGAAIAAQYERHEGAQRRIA